MVLLLFLFYVDNICILVFNAYWHWLMCCYVLIGMHEM
jgi:hypothetical protein